jgi:hypothetical protein
MRDTKRARVHVVRPAARSYTAVKTEWEALIATWARRSFTPWHGPVVLWFEWREADAHRDPDGIAAGGRKLVLDGLVKAGILPSDGARVIQGFVDHFSYGVPPGVDVTILGNDAAGQNEHSIFRHRLPDLNELLALREASARRSVKSQLRGRLA